MSKLYELNLHEILVTEDAHLFTTTMRVPGGWIYRSYDKSNNIMSAVFVRFDNEFQTTEEQK